MKHGTEHLENKTKLRLAVTVTYPSKVILEIPNKESKGERDLIEIENASVVCMLICICNPKPQETKSGRL